MYVLLTYGAMNKYILVSNLTDSGGLSCLHHMGKSEYCEYLSEDGDRVRYIPVIKQYTGN